MTDREMVINRLMETSNFINYLKTSPLFSNSMIGVMTNALYDAITLLKEQGWNVLTEDVDGVIHGLPGDDGQYLMTDGKDIWIDDYVDGVDDGVWLDSGRDIREITAWMHMPELPKKDRW